jgi:predicted RNA-binding protein Jag
VKDAEKDPKKIIEYPPTLNSFERRLIHKVADLIGGINHESTGEGYDRHIVISLIPK